MIEAFRFTQERESRSTLLKTEQDSRFGRYDRDESKVLQSEAILLGPQERPLEARNLPFPDGREAAARSGLADLANSFAPGVVMVQLTDCPARRSWRSWLADRVATRERQVGLLTESRHKHQRPHREEYPCGYH
ncbi:MAG: hypothetical protein ABWY63_13525 [Hyphomicrobiaceae bacterium]